MLSSSKKLSEEISVKQEIATKTEEEIDKTRGGYKPVSRIFHLNSQYFEGLHTKQHSFVAWQKSHLDI